MLITDYFNSSLPELFLVGKLTGNIDFSYRLPDDISQILRRLHRELNILYRQHWGDERDMLWFSNFIRIEKYTDDQEHWR